MRILITGGAGFIGSHTADALAKKGHKIRILDNLKPPVHNNQWPAYLSKKYELVRGDITKKSDWLKALKNIDVIYGLAAHQDQLPNFSKFFNTNTTGTALMFELIVAKKFPIKKFIFASTQFIYGDGRYQTSDFRHQTSDFFYPEFRSLEQLEKGQWDIEGKFIPFTEDQKLTPPNAYSLAKVAQENLSFLFGKRYNIPTVGLRYSAVQGARQSPRNLYSGALRIFATQALSGKDITVYEDGQQLRDFINIKDVVAANLLALENPKTDYEVFNVGGGHPYTILEFAQIVKKVTGSSSKISVSGIFRWGDARHAVSDISKLKKIGWSPKYNAEDSVREYIEWIKNEWRGSFDHSEQAMSKMKKLKVVRLIKNSKLQNPNNK